MWLKASYKISQIVWQMPIDSHHLSERKKVKHEGNREHGQAVLLPARIWTELWVSAFNSTMLWVKYDRVWEWTTDLMPCRGTKSGHEERIWVQFCTALNFLFHLSLPLYMCITYQSRHLFESERCVHVRVCRERSGGGGSQQLCYPKRIGRHHCGSLWSAVHRFSWKDHGRERATDREMEREETLHPGISRASPSASGTYPCSVSEPALLNMKR